MSTLPFSNDDERSPQARKGPVGVEFQSRIKSGNFVSATSDASKSDLALEQPSKGRRDSAAAGYGVQDASLHDSNFALDRAPESLRLTNGDEATVWMDPVSKERLLINSRTGFVVDESALIGETFLDSTEPPTRGPCRTEARRIPRLRSRSPQSCLKPQAGTWIGAFLQGWENPVFQQTEEHIPQVAAQEDVYEKLLSSRGLENLTLTDAFGQVQEARLTKAGLAHATVIAQVDHKFILVLLGSSTPEDGMRLMKPDLMVLIDQHAADERIKVEGLLESLSQKPVKSTRSVQTAQGHTSAIETCALPKNIVYEVNAKEEGLFATHAPYFARWGILYNLCRIASATAIPSRMQPTDTEVCRLDVLALPPCIAERCRTQPRLLIEMLRGEAWKLETSGLKAYTGPSGALGVVDWTDRIIGCPQGILEMVNSRACRSAIMFNDRLSLGECSELVQKLSKCAFPFQCAHGRPSMIPLVNLAADDLGGSTGDFGGDVHAKTVDLNSSWNKWLDES